MRFQAVVLASGLDSGMPSSIPTDFHKIAGRPLLGYTPVALSSLKVIDHTVVIGHKSLEPLLAEYASDIFHESIGFVEQTQDQGEVDAR